MSKREEEVKLIAYNIWQQQGCPNGRDCEQWFMAESIWEEKQKAAGKNSKAEAEKNKKPGTPAKK
jgi:hypothetical protein